MYAASQEVQIFQCNAGNAWVLLNIEGFCLPSMMDSDSSFLFVA
jgi:hypothetical protein